MHAVHDLVLNPADGARNDCSSLPHRLRYSEAKSFAQALLNNYRRAALDCVHHESVFLYILHRQANQVNPIPSCDWKLLPPRDTIFEHQLSLRIVRYPTHVGTD